MLNLFRIWVCAFGVKQEQGDIHFVQRSVASIGWIKLFGLCLQISEHRIDIRQHHQIADTRCHQFETGCGSLAVKHVFNAIEGFDQFNGILFSLPIVV